MLSSSLAKRLLRYWCKCSDVLKRFFLFNKENFFRPAQTISNATYEFTSSIPFVKTEELKLEPVWDTLVTALSSALLIVFIFVIARDFFVYKYECSIAKTKAVFEEISKLKKSTLIIDAKPSIKFYNKIY